MNQLGFDLYKKLYLARRSEEFIVKYYPEDEMKTPMHMSMGQEAISVGVCHALGPEGQIFTSYRTHAAFLAKTEDPDMFFAELYGKVSGTARGKAGSMHLSCPEKGHTAASAIVANCIPVAVGAAFANKQNKINRIACVFFGDGALNEGSFWESLNLACVMEVPVLFVCEDNGFAVHTPKRIREGYKSITDIVQKFDCNVLQENTTDVEVIHQLTLDAASLLEKTEKPVFMHLKCYRYLEHVGISEDFDAGYRPREEFEEWYKRDCVTMQRKKLLDTGHSEEEIMRAEKLIDQRIENSIQRAKEAPFPKPEELHIGVFHEKN